jgi:hypothetical protein
MEIWELDNELRLSVEIIPLQCTRIKIGKRSLCNESHTLMHKASKVFYEYSDVTSSLVFPPYCGEGV